MTMMRRRITAAAIAAAMVALGGCKRDNTSGGAPSGTAPRATSPAIAELLAAVPGSATAIGFVDLESTPWSQVTGGGWFPLDDGNRAALERELRAYLDRYIGLDVSKLQYAVGFLSAPKLAGAVLFKTVSGELKRPGAERYEGGAVWSLSTAPAISLAVRGGVVAVGASDAVREALDTLAGKRAPVTKDNQALVDLLAKDSRGAAAAFAAIRPPALPLPPPVTGLERVAVAIGSTGITAVVDGDDATISGLQGLVEQAIAQGLAGAEQARAAATSGSLPPPEGALAIVSAAYARSYAAKLKPKRTGNRLSWSLDAGLAGANGLAFVGVIGVVSAVAVPAFMDYMKRSKKPEAMLQLNKLAKNAKRAYAEDGRFPAGQTGLTPAAPCCGQPNNHCAAVPEVYAADPAWKALDFSIDEPTLFQYAYAATADGQGFTAKAVGDLDCDGATIEYVVEGTVVDGAPRVRLTEPRPNED